jgi:negative regulator of sigma E activity
MNDLLHEQLSALVDGELPATETTLLLKRLEREPELRARLSRYRVCGETLRGGERVRVRSEFTLRLSAVLRDEPCHAAPARPRREAVSVIRVLKPFAGLAVAAAVAGVAILVLGRPATPGSSTRVAQQPAAATAAPAAAPAAYLATRTPSRALGGADAFGGEPSSYTTPAQQRQALATIPPAELTKYALAHSEVTGPLALHSVLTSLVADEDGGTAAR